MLKPKVIKKSTVKPSSFQYLYTYLQANLPTDSSFYFAISDVYSGL